MGERDKFVDEKNDKKSWSLMIKRDMMTSGILHGLPSLHPDICLVFDQSTAQVWETKMIKKNNGTGTTLRLRILTVC